MSLDYSTPWTQLGEVNLQGCGAVRCPALDRQPWRMGSPHGIHMVVGQGTCSVWDVLCDMICLRCSFWDVLSVIFFLRCSVWDVLLRCSLWDSCWDALLRCSVKMFCWDFRSEMFCLRCSFWDALSEMFCLICSFWDILPEMFCWDVLSETFC